MGMLKLPSRPIEAAGSPLMDSKSIKEDVVLEQNAID
jgi:hypothetical protein